MSLRLLLWVAMVAGCHRGAVWPPVPVPVALGEDACASCRMIVSDSRFGAQLHDRRGGVRHFDDLGCWRKAVAELPPDPAASFVRNFSDGAWIRADRAVVVRFEGLQSPMGSGLAAFATRDAAAAFVLGHAGAVALSLNEPAR